MVTADKNTKHFIISALVVTYTKLLRNNYYLQSRDSKRMDSGYAFDLLVVQNVNSYCCFTNSYRNSFSNDSFMFENSCFLRLPTFLTCLIGVENKQISTMDVFIGRLGQRGCSKGDFERVPGYINTFFMQIRNSPFLDCRKY